MDYLSEKDIKRSKILFWILGLSLFLVPFAGNVMIRSALSFLIFLLVLNTITIITKGIIYKTNK